MLNIEPIIFLHFAFLQFYLGISCFLLHLFSNVITAPVLCAILFITGCHTDGVVPSHHAVQHDPTSHLYRFVFLAIGMALIPNTHKSAC